MEDLRWKESDLLIYVQFFGGGTRILMISIQAWVILLSTLLWQALELQCMQATHSRAPQACWILRQQQDGELGVNKV